MRLLIKNKIDRKMELPDETDIYVDEITTYYPDISSINSSFLPNYSDERGESSAFEMFIFL